MKNIWTGIQGVLAAIGGALGYFLGGLDGFVYALIAFVILDYITGVMSAIVHKQISSDIGYVGIFKKVFIFVLVGVAHIIDLHLIGSGDTIRTAVVFFYISNEGISILENAGEIGLPIPDKLKEILMKIRQKGDGGDNDNASNP